MSPFTELPERVHGAIIDLPRAERIETIEGGRRCSCGPSPPSYRFVNSEYRSVVPSTGKKKNHALRMHRLPVSRTSSSLNLGCQVVLLFPDQPQTMTCQAWQLWVLGCARAVTSSITASGTRAIPLPHHAFVEAEPNLVKGVRTQHD